MLCKDTIPAIKYGYSLNTLVSFHFQKSNGFKPARFPPDSEDKIVTLILTIISDNI